MGSLLHPPIKVLLITIYPLWAEACSLILESLPRGINVTALIADDELSSNLHAVLATCQDVVLVSLDLPAQGFNSVHLLRSSGYAGGVIVICSHYSLPSLDALTEARVQAIVSSLATLDELASSIYAVADGHPDPLLQQYLRATRSLTRRVATQSLLNEREKEILQLVASDLTDHEIAEHLHISARTVSNQLHYIYYKLGVKGRAGAVIAALTQGLIRLNS